MSETEGKSYSNCWIIFYLRNTKKNNLEFKQICSIFDLLISITEKKEWLPTILRPGFYMFSHNE